MPNKTKIEWTDYSCNPIKGVCQYNCLYCYAIRMYKRFKWNPKVRLDLTAFDGVEKLKSGSKIFIGSTHDVFGHWIPDNWIETIIEKVKSNCSKTFIFLTKNPKRYSNFDFPQNAWIGYSTTGALYHEWNPMHEHNIKFISIEPMMGELTNTAYLHDTDFIIVGSETGNRKGKIVPKIEWIGDVIQICEKTGIKLFLKNNLNYEHKIQNLPL